MNRIYTSLILAGNLLCTSILISQTPPDQTTIFRIQEEYTKSVDDPGAILFTPPPGWAGVDQKLLTPHVKVMIIGKGLRDYPPSLNLGMEPYRGTVKEYLKTIKTINDSQGAEWKDLGLIQTQAGNASLSQVDMKTEWGDVRLIHVIILKNEMLYVLTAAALKEEFSVFYKDFFSSFRSLRFNKEAVEMVANARRRNTLQKELQEVKAKWIDFYVTKKNENSPNNTEEIFLQEPFNHDVWSPFIAMLDKNYSDMGLNWKDHLIAKTKQDLLKVANISNPALQQTKQSLKK